jgi:hypothetical protein
MKKFLIIAFAAILLLLIFGCKTKEKAIKKWQETSSFAKACADSFPVRVDSIYVEGGWITDTVWNYDTQTLFDTITQKVDTIIYKTKVVTNKRVDTLQITKEDSARLKQYQLELKEQAEMHEKEIALLNKYLEESKAETEKEIALLNKYLEESKAETEKEKEKSRRNGKQRNVVVAIAAIYIAHRFGLFHKLIGLISGGIVPKFLGIFLGLFNKRKK